MSKSPLAVYFTLGGEEKLGEWASPLIGLGVRKTNNSSDDGVPFEQVNEYDEYFQVGLEVSPSQDWDLRLSYKDYSDGSSVFAVSIIVPFF